MSLCLFKYADGRREFREVDTDGYSIVSLFDPPTLRSWSAFSTMSDTQVTVRKFRRTEYRCSPDFHGPHESPSWWLVMHPAYDASDLDRKIPHYRREYRYIEAV